MLNKEHRLKMSILFKYTLHRTQNKSLTFKIKILIKFVYK